MRWREMESDLMGGYDVVKSAITDTPLQAGVAFLSSSWSEALLPPI
jgi:hypothetical protein